METFPPNIVQFIQEQISQLQQFGRTGATRIYRAPRLAAPIPIGPASISSPVNIRFREPGIVIAAYGQEQRGTVPAFAATEVRVQIGGQDDLVTDGQSGQFAPMLALFGPNLNWFPLTRRAIPGVDWTITYRNEDTANTAIPAFMLAFIADADLRRMGAMK